MAAIDYGIKCPTCSAGMVLRTAGKGPNSGKQFYGCSRFPRCRGTKNLGHNETGTTTEKAAASVLPIDLNPFLHHKVESNQNPNSPKTPLTDTQKKQLSTLRDRLLNVSSRNRSIRLNRIDKKSAFDLSQLNHFNSSFANELIEHCLNQTTAVPVFPAKDADNEKLWDQ